MDSNTGSAGVAEKKSTKGEAVRTALDQCRSSGGSDCRELLTYHNQCVAVAQNRSGGPVDAYGGARLKDAEVHALEACGGEEKCRIMYKACSYQERVN
ncbi:DUF4189 domain-containing protein [Luteibacter sp. CQ10]